MPVMFEFKDLFSLGGRSKKGFSATINAKAIVPDGKDAVYFIKHGSNKTIYIGATWFRVTKSEKKYDPSVIKRLEYHVDKFLNAEPVEATKTHNWTQYRNKFNNHNDEIQKWKFGVFWKDEISPLTAHDFEEALIVTHTAKYGNAPKCNDEYNPDVDKLCVIKAILSL